MEKEKNKIDVTHHTFCQNDKSYAVMKSNLPSEYKWMHKFTKVASGKREKQNSCHSPHFLSEWIKLWSNENLPAEDKWMHKFPKVASGEREKQNWCHSPHFLSEW